jgi:hypothetical protein
VPPFRFSDDGWIFDPLHWLGPQCRIDCYPDKLLHLLAGFAIAAAFVWGYARWRRRPGPWWAHAAVVPVIAALKEIHDWLLSAPDTSGFWRDQGPSWRDFLATVLGQILFWGVVWLWRLRSCRGARAAGEARPGA